MATLPVISLRRIKTYLRSTMDVERLNGLAFLNIHRDIRVSPEHVLDKLFEKNLSLAISVAVTFVFVMLTV